MFNARPPVTELKFHDNGPVVSKIINRDIQTDSTPYLSRQTFEYGSLKNIQRREVKKIQRRFHCQATSVGLIKSKKTLFDEQNKVGLGLMSPLKMHKLCTAQTFVKCILHNVIN